VRRAFDKYIDCGQLQRGFLRLKCRSCGDESLVAFSCKRRGICPPCAARRAAEIAAHLCDNVLPAVAYRQWTISCPFPLRFRLARDAPLRHEVLALAVEAISKKLRELCGEPAGETGCIGLVQNFGNSLNLNLHLHLVAGDGVWLAAGTGGAAGAEAAPNLKEE
jgi:hypothetical protein